MNAPLPKPMSDRKLDAAVWLGFALAAILFLFRSTLLGEAFAPAGLLGYLAPWTTDSRPPWNPLHYDAIGQFIVWRDLAGRSIRAGELPLWNPFAFCGTPFVANSQSAVFYPGNVLFVLLPVARAAGWSAALHLTLAAGFTYGLCRRLGMQRLSAVSAGLMFAYGSWQVSWLQLPTFHCTSCYIPLALSCTWYLCHRPTGRNAIWLGLALGLSLLGGHLQIAFYGLLAVGLFGLSIIINRCIVARSWRKGLRSVAGFAVALTLAGALAAPQVLPSLELSRRSHRVGSPTPEGYNAYVNYAVAAFQPGTLVLPNLFGNPTYADMPYVGLSRGGMLFNYAEGAMYVGIAGGILAIVGLTAGYRRKRILFFGGLALLSMLIALGTDVDRLFYFFVPGFAQSGSPGRGLVLWSLACAVLAGFGIESVFARTRQPVEAHADERLVNRGMVLSVVAGALALLMGLSAYQFEIGKIPGGAGSLLLPISLTILTIGSIWFVIRGKGNRVLAGWLPVALVGADLWAVGIGYNPSSPAAQVYPETPLITRLRNEAGHDRIMPVNGPHFSFRGPNSVLPPNGATYFGLRDIQGYDSLFSGRYKAFMNRLAAPIAVDSSPPEVGNMVFARNPASPLVLDAGVKVIVSSAPLELPGWRTDTVEGISVAVLNGASGRARAAADDGQKGTVEWIADSMNRVSLQVYLPASGSLILADQHAPGWRATVDGVPTDITLHKDVFRNVRLSSGSHRVEFQYVPTSILFGIYLAIMACAVMTGLMVFRKTSTKST